MAGPDDYAQLGRAATSGFGNARARGSMAEMAAQRLEGFGAEGAQWAQRLRHDPRAAVAMAQQYGGFAQIEQGLRYGSANRQGATAEHLERLGLQLEGAGAFKDIGAGALAARESARPPERLRELRKEFRDDSKGFATQRDYYERASAAASKAQEAGDPKARGSADFVLIQAMGKMVDPDSVVRNEEGRLIQAAGSSEFGTWMQGIQRIFGANGINDPVARYRLIEQLQAQYDAARSGQARRVDLFSNEVVRDFGFPEEYVGMVIPDNADPALGDGGKVLDIDFWAQAANAEQGQADTDGFIAALEAAAPGTTLRGPNGALYRKNESGASQPYSRVDE